MARHDNIPSTQTAVIAGPTGEFVISHDVPIIDLEPEAVIIKTTAVALNPADTKMVGDFVVSGAIFGFDCAGTVVAVGSAVRKDLKIGDRVCGSADGMSRLRPLGGGFAQYVSLPGDMALKIPENVTCEAAAAYGTALTSAGMALFYSLKIPANLLEEPAKVPFPVLVYGGSTSTGTMAIQILKAYVSTLMDRQFHSYSNAIQMRYQTHYNLLSKELCLGQILRCRTSLRLQLPNLRSRYQNLLQKSARLHPRLHHPTTKYENLLRRYRSGGRTLYSSGPLPREPSYPQDSEARLDLSHQDHGQGFNLARAVQLSPRP